MLDYLGMNIQNRLLPDVFDNIFPNLLMFMTIIPKVHPHNLCMYVSKEELGDRKRQVIVVFVSRIMFLIMLIRNVQLVNLRTHPKIVLVFKRRPYYTIQQYPMHGSINGNDAFSVYICVDMHMYMHMCAI